MKIIQVTDLHLVTPGDILCERDPLKNLQACIADINENHADAELVIFTGDLSDTGHEDSYQALAGELEKLIPSYKLLLGNHDNRSAFLRVFDSVTPEDGFVQSVVDTAQGRLILLDTLSEGFVEGRLDETRQAWLKRRLAEAAGRPVFLFLHHPPFPIFLPLLDGLGLVESEALHAMLREHGNVRHIFVGHAHRPVAGRSAVGCPAAAPQAPLSGATATAAVGAEQACAPVAVPALATGVTQKVSAWPASSATGVYCRAVAPPMGVLPRFHTKVLAPSGSLLASA
ncbi:MAG: phosphodiesterase [Phyllobacterium sp.]|nr:phosphodiesterase [Phyllobacterium sp.]